MKACAAAPPKDIFNKMDRLVGIMEKAVEDRLAGTEYADRILGPQAHLIDAGQRNRTLLPNDLFNNVTKYITAIMEVKSAMGVIVAAPTAGSCGEAPRAPDRRVGRTLGLPREDRQGHARRRAHRRVHREIRDLRRQKSPG